MTAQRILVGAVLAVTASAAAAQPPAAYPPPPPTSLGGGLLTAPSPMAAGTGMTPTQTLTTPAGLPPGTVASPWSGGSPAGANCCGPVGANGPVIYELYVRTGPNLIVGGSPELSGAARFGWQVNGGGRTLFMNTDRDAAFVVDLGLMYAYDGMSDSRVFDVFARTPASTSTNAQGQTTTTPQPDQLQPFRIRSLTRTGLTYAVGRDWWLNGPATTGTESGFNSRVGIDLGGRWNTIRAGPAPRRGTGQLLPPVGRGPRDRGGGALHGRDADGGVDSLWRRAGRVRPHLEQRHPAAGRQRARREPAAAGGGAVLNRGG